MKSIQYNGDKKTNNASGGTRKGGATMAAANRRARVKKKGRLER